MRHNAITLLSGLLLGSQPLPVAAQDFNIDGIANTMINNQMMNNVMNKRFAKDRPVEILPIAPPVEATELHWRFDTPSGWQVVGPGMVEGPDGIRISVADIARRPSENRSKEKWLQRRIDVLFAGERIVEQDREPTWQSAAGDDVGVLKTRLWTATPDGHEEGHILQADFNADAVRLLVVSARTDRFEQHKSAIATALGTILDTLTVEQVRFSLDGNPVTVMSPEHVIELEGMSWELQPGMKHQPKGNFCAWQCVTFGPDPEIVVHEPLPLSPRAAIETLVATFDDPVADRITSPTLHPWFGRSELTAELIHRDGVGGFTITHFLIPVTDGNQTVLVEMRGSEDDIFERLPTAIAFIDSLRID